MWGRLVHLCVTSDVDKRFFVYGGHNGSPLMWSGLYYPPFFLLYLVSSLSPPPPTSLLLPQLTGTLRHKETIAEDCRNNYILQLEQTNAKRRQHYDSDMPQVFKVWCGIISLWACALWGSTGTSQNTSCAAGDSVLALIPGCPTIQFLIAYKWRVNPRNIYRVNDVNVCLGRQGGGAPDRKNAFHSVLLLNNELQDFSFSSTLVVTTSLKSTLLVGGSSPPLST